jgi:hypothetical protein
MGRLSKRTIQCRAARQQRLLKQQAAAAALGDSRAPGAGAQRPAGHAAAAAHAPARSPSALLLRKLGTASLQRYLQAHSIDLDPECAADKEELVSATARHFSMSEVGALPAAAARPAAPAPLPSPPRHPSLDAAQLRRVRDGAEPASKYAARPA